MALAERATGSGASFSSPCTITLSGSPVSGDLILVFVDFNNDTSGVHPTPAITGFTSLGSSTASVWSRLTLLGKIAAGTEGTSLSLTWSGTAAAACAALVVSGASSSLPTNIITTPDASSDTTASIPAITTAAANSWDVAAVCFGGNNDYNATGTNYSAWGGSLVEKIDVAAGSGGFEFAGVGMAYVARASAGSQAATSVTQSTADVSGAIRVEVLESGAAPATLSPPALVGAGTPAFTATASATITPGLPTGWLADDVHILIASGNNNVDWPEPSGWTKLSPGAVAENNTVNMRVELWARRAVGGDTAPVMSTYTGTTVRGAQIIGIRGCSTAGAVSTVIAGMTRSNNASSTTATWATLTPGSGNPNTLMVALLAYQDNITAAVTLSNFTAFNMAAAQQSSLGNDMALTYAARPWLDGTVATGALTSVTSGAAANVSVGILLALTGVTAPTAPTTGYGATVLATSGLRSYWRLDEAGGSAQDQVGGITGVVIGSPTRQQASLIASDSADKTTLFDGTNDAVNFLNPSYNFTGTATFSFECLFRPATAGASVFLSVFDRQTYSPSRSGWCVFLSVNQLGIEIWSAGAYGSGVYINSLVASTTYHVVFTASTTTLTSYLNGVLQFTAARTSIPAAGTAFRIGGTTDSAAWMNGIVDEVAIYDVELSGATAAAHYAALAAAGVTVDVSASPASSAGTAVNPTVVLGSVTVTLTSQPASAAGTAVNPTLRQGSLTLTPGAASAAGTAVDPTVSIAGGGLTVNVSALPASAAGAAVSPSVIQSSLTLTPGAASAAGTAVTPTVTITGGGLTVNAASAPATATGTAIDPNVRLGSLTINLSAIVATAMGSAVSPTVTISGGGLTVNVSAAPASAAGTAVNPSVRQGSVTVDVGAAAASGTAITPSVRQGSLTVSLAALPASATGTAISPSVVLVDAFDFPLSALSVVARPGASSTAARPGARSSAARAGATSTATRPGATSLATRPASTSDV